MVNDLKLITFEFLRYSYPPFLKLAAVKTNDLMFHDLRNLAR